MITDEFLRQWAKDLEGEVIDCPWESREAEIKAHTEILKCKILLLIAQKLEGIAAM